MYYLAMDGGGTKLIGLLFDDRYRLVASARAKGTHRAIYPLQEVRDHIAECYRQLFRHLPKPLHIETLYTICGDSALYAKLLPKGVSLGTSRYISESVSALYAGSGAHSGFVALSGTGSDVFCIENDRLLHVIGGWGAILGDEGSGAWMAQQAMSAAIRAEGGWGPATVFGSAVKDRFGFQELRDYVAYLYDSPSPFQRLGELLPLVAQTAREGDEVMLDIFRQGGQMMARQMLSMLRSYPQIPPHITACGGAWKAHPAMAEAFTEAVKEEVPEAVFMLPKFEHIMAGPVCLAMENGQDPDSLFTVLAENFPDYLWNHA